MRAQSCGTFAIGSDTCAAACPKNQVYGVQSNHAGSNGVLYCCGWTNLTPLPNANEQSCPALGYFDGTTCYLSDGRCYASQQEAQSQSYAQCQGNCVDSSWRQPLGGFECLDTPTAPMDTSTNPRRYCCPAGTILQDDRCIAETAALPTCVNEGQKRCLSQTAFDFDLEIAGAEPACRSAQNSTNVIVCCPEGKTLDANQCVEMTPIHSAVPFSQIVHKAVQLDQSQEHSLVLHRISTPHQVSTFHKEESTCTTAAVKDLSQREVSVLSGQRAGLPANSWTLQIHFRPRSHLSSTRTRSHQAVCCPGSSLSSLFHSQGSSSLS